MGVPHSVGCVGWPRFALRQWDSLFDVAIGNLHEVPLRVDAVLLHPRRGVALIDIAPKATPRAAQIMRQTILQSGLLRRRVASLPIVYCCLSLEEVPHLASLLDTAFAGQEPVPLHGRGWVRSLRGLLGEGHRRASHRLPAWLTAPAALLVAGLLLSGTSPALILARLHPPTEAEQSMTGAPRDQQAVDEAPAPSDIASLPMAAPPRPDIPPSQPVPAAFRLPQDTRKPARPPSAEKPPQRVSADRALPSWQPADPRCAPLLARLQLGETPSPDARHVLQTACAPHP
ncbi:hypothetical protein SAMN04487779_103421 [Belnapia rosea]|uniref:Uncharacterized protein n=2 Tax=Belnapia rosea TaxID=938405 RepID=A0A1G7CSF3_9PROT|nr:hypothetical protein SAMN04487779_103421 [Belnapia rosea]